MRILRNYLLSEFFTGFFMSIFLFLGLFLLGNFFKLAEMIIKKGLNIGYAVKLLLWGLPSLLNFALPIAGLLGCFLSLGRMHNDNEIVAIKTSGINFRNFIMPIIILGVILSLSSFVLFFNIIPEARYNQRSILKKIGILSPQTLFEPGTFINAFKDTMVFVYDVKGNTLYNIFIYKSEEGKTRTIFAKKAKFITENNSVKLKLEDGVSDQIDPENPDQFYKMKFKISFIKLDLETDKQVSKRAKDMNWDNLVKNLQTLEGKDRIPFSIELSKRINMSLWPLLFLVLGTGLAQKIKIRSKSMNFCVGFLISGLFYICYLFTQGLSVQSKLPPPVALSLPTVIFAAVGIYFLYKE